MTSERARELRECPFCGTDADLMTIETRAGDQHWWHVFCDNCCTDGPTSPTKNEAERAWNERPAALSNREAVIEALGFKLEGDILRYDDGSCRGASMPEMELWAALATIRNLSEVREDVKCADDPDPLGNINPGEM